VITTPAEILARAAKNLLELGRLDLARKAADLAVSEDSRCANAHSVLAVVHDALAEWREGLEHGRRAVELVPGSPQMKYNLALANLRLDDYRTGFALMEARIDKPDWTGLAIAPSRAAERHRLLRPGDAVEGRRILVITEQGLRDCIMFARHLPLLARRGARITLACSPPLQPIFERVPGIDALLSPPPDQPLAKINLSQAEFDAWVPLLSLPFPSRNRIRNTTGGNPLPLDRPRPHRGLARTLRDGRPRRDAQNRLGVAGEPGERFGVRPLAADRRGCAALADDRGRLGQSAGRHRRPPAGCRASWHHRCARPRDPARRVPCCGGGNRSARHRRYDGGALRRRNRPSRVWIMVPDCPHWAWGIGRDHTPWYPTARLFRRNAPRDWSDVIETVARRLVMLPENKAYPEAALPRPSPWRPDLCPQVYSCLVTASSRPAANSEAEIGPRFRRRRGKPGSA
jgi:hypothetical protein